MSTIRGVDDMAAVHSFQLVWSPLRSNLTPPASRQHLHLRLPSFSPFVFTSCATSTPVEGFGGVDCWALSLARFLPRSSGSMAARSQGGVMLCPFSFSPNDPFLFPFFQVIHLIFTIIIAYNNTFQQI